MHVVLLAGLDHECAPYCLASGSDIVRLFGIPVGNAHYRQGVKTSFLRVCFGKVRSHARPDQFITFTRCPREAPPVEYRNLPPGVLAIADEVIE